MIDYSHKVIITGCHDVANYSLISLPNELHGRIHFSSERNDTALLYIFICTEKFQQQSTWETVYYINVAHSFVYFVNVPICPLKS